MTRSKKHTETADRSSHVKKLSEQMLHMLSTTLSFRIIVSLSVLQGIWYSLSFRPHIFDESIHLGFIKLYAGRLNPFLSEQSMQLDFLGEVTRNASYLYYYLMSFPLRLVSVFTDSEFSRIVFLRCINVALFAGGLILYRKAFIAAGASKIAANLALLFLILTPSIAPLNGSVNYDNAIFLMGGMILLLAVNIVKSKQMSFTNLTLFLITGLLASLIKFEFIALFAPVAIYICLDLWQKHRGKTGRLLKQSFDKLTFPIKLILVSGLVLAAGLFIERPVMNAVTYHRISPRCTQILSEERCARNYTAQRNMMALSAKPENFSPMNPFNYVLQEWIPGMITTETIIPPTQLSSAPLRLAYYAMALGGGLVLMYYLRDLLKKTPYRLLLFAMVSFTVLLALYNYQSYANLGRPVAITGRYLLLVMPIFILFVGLSMARLLRRNARVLAAGVVAALLVFSQGGGVLTLLISSPNTMYWPNSIAAKQNAYLKNRLEGWVRLQNVP